MFGSSKKAKANNEPTSTPTSSNSGGGTINSIGKGTKINGEVASENDIRVDGEIVGTLKCKGKLIIGPSGLIDGTVNCTNAVVEGSFKGKLVVKELLNVRQNSKIDGEISTGQLTVEPGAEFNVSCIMGNNGSSNSSIKPKKSGKPEIKLQV